MAHAFVRFALALVLIQGCATIPRQQYGVKRMRFEGMEELDDDALRACLATRERKRLTLGLSALRDPACGKPPFGPPRRTLMLFSVPWADWPVYDESVFRLDLERIERWYEARGYYGAHVVGVDLNPTAAKESDVCTGEDCAVSLTIHIEQGEPVRMRRVEIANLSELSPQLHEDLMEALEPLAKEEIFDEAVYEKVKSELSRVMREEGYARAQVDGEVVIHRGLLWAEVSFRIKAGQLCRIGNVRVKSSSPIPEGPVLLAADLRRGQVYRESDLDDAQRTIYALTSFSAVTVRGDLDGEGEFVDVTIELTPRRESEVLLGAGVMSGMLTTGPLAEEWMSVPQWDIHLIGRYEHRNFFGGLRRLHVEERPRLMFLDSFPDVPSNSPQFGNTLNASFVQPGFLEVRTSLVVDGRWDVGPDPFLLFMRHDVGVAVGLERGFFRQRLNVRMAVHQDLFEVPSYQPISIDQPLPSSFRLPFLEERLILDLRDDAANPSRGAYFRLGLHEAVRLWDPSWNYLRVLPEARAYAPLGLGVVLATRAALGALFIFDASSELDEVSRRLGPQTYRLRGGGAQSNRGFNPGQLGDGTLGGIRRWEGSLELRVPLSKSFSVATFGDVGDVHAGSSFRFGHLNTSVGGGLRYRTIIGPIRFDVGYRVPGAQRVDGSAAPHGSRADFRIIKFDGAFHLTIGESF